MCKEEQVKLYLITKEGKKLESGYMKKELFDKQRKDIILSGIWKLVNKNGKVIDESK